MFIEYREIHESDFAPAHAFEVTTIKFQWVDSQGQGNQLFPEHEIRMGMLWFPGAHCVMSIVTS
jgi:hypothetical protein